MSPLRYVARNSLDQYRANQVLPSLSQEHVSLETRSSRVGRSSLTSSTPNPTVSPAEEDTVAGKFPIPFGP